MNNNQETITSSQQLLLLPEPDLANITVLAHNLPNKPILPWNRFDYTGIQKKVNQREQKLSTNLSILTILVNASLPVILLALFLKDSSVSIEIETKNTNQPDSEFS